MSVVLRIVGVAIAGLLVCLLSLGLGDDHLSAERALVSHEVVSWNDDGTVTASVWVVLPSEFRDTNGSAAAEVVCGTSGSCYNSQVSIELSDVSEVVGSITMTLQPGDNPLTVTVTAHDANGAEIKYQSEEYIASVPHPQPLEVEFISYSIDEFSGNGTAKGVLRFLVKHLDEWPMYFFSASVECADGSECSGQNIVWPGWFHDIDRVSTKRDYSPHEVHIEVSGLVQGMRELSVKFQDVDPQWWGGEPRVTVLEGIVVPVPIAQSLDVRVLGSEVINYNDDDTANVSLEMSMERLDDWPLTSVVATFTCNGEVDCEYEQVFSPSWTDGLAPSESFIDIHLNGVPPGDVNMSATFKAVHEDWTGSERLTILDEIVFTVPEQSEFDVRWLVGHTEADGYYMDGSGNVNLSLSAYNRGYGEAFQDEISAVCIDAMGDNAARCHQFDPAVKLNLSDEESVIQLPPIRLPQGESKIRIEAGAASGEASVHVQERAVGISRDLWDCFYETEVEAGETCGGFNQPIIQKWTLKSLNVYREGDPLYVEIFDDVLDTISEITGIEYVIVDNFSDAHVEAYVGHEGHPRALQMFGQYCAYGPGCAFHFSHPSSPHELTGAAITVGKRHPSWRDPSITLEEEIRFTTLHEALHVLIPIGHDSRPFSYSLVDKPSYIRNSDEQIFRMIYTPGVKPGMSFDELLEFVVFDDETIDYKRAQLQPDVQAIKAIRRLYDADNIKMKITGIDVRGSAEQRGTTLDVQYSGFMDWWSTKVRFWSQSWSSIIFGYDAESWSSAGGRWTMSSDHIGRARDYRDHLKFDFILADPVPLLQYYMFSGQSLTFVKRGDGTLVFRSEPSTDGVYWPRPTAEVVLDPESGEMRSYVIDWQFEPDSRYRYRIKAEVVSYGEEFEIPDEVREKSEYLRQFEDNTETEDELEENGSEDEVQIGDTSSPN